MTNAENIRKVIAMIEKEENYFNMKRWGTNAATTAVEYPENVCGTPSCIGGWSEAIMAYEQGLPRDIQLGGDSSPIADATIANWLGLSEEQAHSLFFPDIDENIAAYEASRQQAVAHLEYIIETGEVDWSRFVVEEPV